MARACERCVLVVATAGLAASLWLAGDARAESGPMRTVVRAAASADRELLSRVQGQTVDVAVELLPASDPLERTVSAQLRAAVALSRVHDARVVIWFRHLPDGAVVVYVADPGAGTVLIRQVAAPLQSGAAVDPSAAAEAAALVVRSALKALAAGGRIGVERAEVAAVPDAETPPPAAVGEVHGASDRSAWLTSVGWHGAFDGASDFGAHGITARVGWQRGRLILSAMVAASLPAVIEDELTSVEIARHAAAASVGLEMWSGERVALGAELGVGAVGFFRSTVALTTEALPTPSRVTTALLIAPGLRLRVRPLSSIRSLWLHLGAAADVVVGRPELGYETDAGFVRRDQLWPVQPRLELGVGLRAF